MTTERIIEYILPTENEAAAPQTLRLVISEMNTLQHARWLRYQREVHQWAVDTLGISEELDSEKELSLEVADRQERGYRRAAMLGALRRIEIGTCTADADEPTTWTEATLPQEWQTIDGFIDDMPFRLFDLWMLLAVECNPGAFFAEGKSDPDQKKRTPGQICVRSSMKRLTIS